MNVALTSRRSKLHSAVRKAVGATAVCSALALPPAVDAVPMTVGSEFQVNTFTSSDQRAASVAIDAGGNFVVAWNSNGQDGSGFGVFAQRFDTTGTPAGSEFPVNTFTSSNQNNPSVAMDDSGNFVVVWPSPQDGPGFGIFGQRFDASGVPVDSEFQVSTSTSSFQQNPSVAMDAGGNFIVAWDSQGQDGSGNGVFAQRFDATGTPAGSELQINTFTSGAQETPSVAMDSNGNFVVAWESFGQDGSFDGVFAQRYDATGAPAGSEFQVNTFTSSFQQNPSVAMDAGGNFVVAWSSGTCQVE